MPAKARGAAGSRCQLLVKRACEVSDPLAALPRELLEYAPQPQQEGPTSEGAAASGGRGAAGAGGKPTGASGKLPLSDDSLPDSATVVSDQKCDRESRGITLPVDAASGPEPPLSSSFCTAAGAIQELPVAASSSASAVAQLLLQPAVIRFKHARAGQLSPEQIEWALTLVRDSLRPMYEKVWGWSDAKKRAQLEAAASRFVLAVDEEGRPAAYVNFRLEQYERRPVCYLYEVMVAGPYRRLGIGRQMMSVVEQMAWSLGMERCVLTEFCVNKAAETFYRQLGYRMDESNPPGSGSCGYVILSKGRPADV